MGYIKDFEKEFRVVLGEGVVENTVKFAKDKVLESYRNGQSEKKDGADKEKDQS